MLDIIIFCTGNANMGKNKNLFTIGILKALHDSTLPVLVDCKAFFMPFFMR